MMKDSEFIRSKVPMTKEAVRAISIDKLQLRKAQNFLDIGAGTGSLSLQSAIEYPHLDIIAVEKNIKAIDLIHENIKHFDLKNIRVVEGDAPLLDQPTINNIKFDSIFIGGSGGNLPDIIDWSWKLLKEDGTIVLNFILLENAFEALSFLKESGWSEIETCQNQSYDLVTLGSGHYFKPQNPTIIISAKKGI